MNIKKIGVVGAGQMGRGIAQVAAMSGYETQIFDISTESLSFAKDFITKQLAKGVTKGKWEESLKTESLARLTTTDNMSDLGDCDLLIEAATENKEIKFSIFRNLELPK